MEHQTEVTPVSIIAQDKKAPTWPVRVDAFLSEKIPGYSRSFFQKLAHAGQVTINGKTSKASASVKANDTVTVQLPKARPVTAPKMFERDPGVLVIHEQSDFVIIQKPANLMSHAPSIDGPKATLVDWILHRYPSIRSVGQATRPGIVHRLDKDTSGLMIIPKTDTAYHTFRSLFKERAIEKTYVALVHGKPCQQGTIDLSLDRHPRHQFKMVAVDASSHRGRTAITNYRVIHYFEQHALLELKPVTGRTHQLRVHLAAIGHPIIGDALYGKRSDLIGRQALHARSLTFSFGGIDHHFSCSIPDDITLLIERLTCNCLTGECPIRKTD